MTDKGKGFYHGTGRITDEYKTVLSDCGLRPLMGESNTVQPGDCQELMLHETAVAWVRRKLEHTLPGFPHAVVSTLLLCSGPAALSRHVLNTLLVL